MNSLVKRWIHGVILILTPGLAAGVKAQVARPTSRSHGTTEKEVGRIDYFD
ncbi:hypothetical protein [Arthrobacter sp. H16F315]|uniref:hypothetical protein n=1 Tax=Arthrobacter sp. H16F315 TaxID=2955314 RepID=UPI002097A8A0|nr:hypothetical protein [Arthrobacter sp. H16F315]MDD1476157.1 hypothetical protein [Arthrobacter sp. H16F315]